MEGTTFGHLTSGMADFAQRAARCSDPVLLLGETGSGKTHLASVIHALSHNHRGPLITVNCAALPETLFEREMFGHVRGAFTDARDSQPGLFEAADGGTLVLDEIGDIPLAAQAKLLAAIDTMRVRRVGSTRDITVRGRVIAATNGNLEELVRGQRFRADLYYRVAVLCCRVPSLRERVNELPAIVSYLLERITADRDELALSSESMAAFTHYTWPGNIRELDNALRYARTFCDDGVIQPWHLPADVRRRRAPENGAQSSRPRYSTPLDPDEERENILSILNASGGNRTRAAERLGISRSSLWMKLKFYRIGGINIRRPEHPT